jgi:HK97 family phage portal protein
VAKSLIAAIADGVRPLSLKAQLQDWLGVPVTLQSGDFWRAWSGAGSFLGKRVTVDNALQLATVWACVRLIAETLATLPMGFYRRNADGSRTAEPSHPLYELLHYQPNADMTANCFWEIVVASMLLWGNAYIEIIRSGSTVISLHFLHPARMVVRRLFDGTLEFRYRDLPASAVARVIPEENMMHILAFSTDGFLGLSPIVYGANVFGTSIETDLASAETFRDSTRASGIVTMDAILKKDQREEIREHVKTVNHDGGVYVLEKGSGFQKLGFDPASAETLASRKWNTEECCRWYRVDPSMIGHGGKDSNWGTGLEQKMIWFLTFTLRQWCVRIEQAVRKCLLTPVERQKYFAEFAIEGLLRGDATTRSVFYSKMVDAGIYTRDECRQFENLAPKGGNANVLTVQSAMVAIDDMNKGTNSAAPTFPPQTTKALDDMIVEMKAMRNRPLPSPAPINVDARTTVNAPPAANVTVNVPERDAAPINVDARTTVNAPPAADVTVNVPEHKAPDVNVEVAAPVVNMAPPDITVNIESGDGDKMTTYERDPKTKEILSSTTKNRK